jgi:hypothetical protein
MHTGRALLQEQNAAAFAQINPGNNKFLLLRQKAAAKMLQPRESVNFAFSTSSAISRQPHSSSTKPAPSTVPTSHHSTFSLDQPLYGAASTRVQQRQAAAIPIPVIEDMPAVSQATLQATLRKQQQQQQQQQHRDPAAETSSSRVPAAPALQPRGSSPAQPVATAELLDTRVAKAQHTPNFASEVEDHGIPAIARIERQSCRFCQRQFAVDRLSKHMVICQQNLNSEKSRKVVDLRTKRVEALYAANQAPNDAQHIVRKLEAEEQRLGSSTGSSTSPRSGTAKWRLESAQFQRAMKGEVAGSEPPADDRVPCPHCGRKFNAMAAERHIPKCNSQGKGPR